MKWTEYAIAMLLFSVVSMLLLYLMQRVQGFLPFNPQKFAAVSPAHLAFNTAASFTTNTNWQSYSGESTMSYFTQMAGLAYHNFISAATGIALAIAFVRGIARRQMQTIGNFWVDMVRSCLWVLLPFCVVGALVLVSQGVVQNLKPYDAVKLVEPQQVQHVNADGKPAVDAAGKPVMDTVARNHQGIGHQRRRILQRQQLSSLRKSQPAVKPDRVVYHLRHLGRTHLHAGPHDRLAIPWLGGVGSDGSPLSGRSHGRVLGRSSRQSFAAWR
jgi:hypothetical protein